MFRRRCGPVAAGGWTVSDVWSIGPGRGVCPGTVGRRLEQTRRSEERVLLQCRRADYIELDRKKTRAMVELSRPRRER